MDYNSNIKKCNHQIIMKINRLRIHDIKRGYNTRKEKKLCGLSCMLNPANVYMQTNVYVGTI